MIRFALLFSVLAVLGASVAHATPTEDETAARAIFERNLQAIAERGFESLATSMDQDSWPDLFEAQKLEVLSLVPGVVYGQYRYRVRFGESESRGVSERLFLLTDEGWRIAVTTAFTAPENVMNESSGDERDR